MKSISRNSMKRASVLAVAVAMSVAQTACASRSVTARPEDIPRLEQDVTRSPGNADATARLGAAYVAAKRFEDAKRVLSPLVAAGTNNGAAYLYLGIANEELGDYAGARIAYDRYLEIGRDPQMK